VGRSGQGRVFALTVRVIQVERRKVLRYHHCHYYGSPSSRRTPSSRLLLPCFIILATGSHSLAQPGTVESHYKISDTAGACQRGTLLVGDSFGVPAAIGDLDNDGVDDLAVGAFRDDDGGLDRGAVWVLFLNENGTVKCSNKISDLTVNLGLTDSQFFGKSVTALGDLDGDGCEDIAVGAPGDDQSPSSIPGTVFILFLNIDGTVKHHEEIGDGLGIKMGLLEVGDFFGTSLTALGDLDGDTFCDIAVGADGDDDGDDAAGAVWILFLNSNGTVKSHQKISDTAGGFGGTLGDNFGFGIGVAALGRLDEDDVPDLAVGVFEDDDGGPCRGAVWILFLNPTGTVKEEQKISDLYGGFEGMLSDEGRFGESVAFLSDLNQDGVDDLAVGAAADQDGRGAVWILFLNQNGTVKGEQKITAGEGEFPEEGLDPGDLFGWWGVSLGDLDGDGTQELAVGAPGDDDGGLDSGAVWVLSLESGSLCPADLDGDGEVGIIDFLELLGAWGPCPDPCPPFCFGDSDGDCQVGIVDFLQLLAQWGPCP